MDTYGFYTGQIFDAYEWLGAHIGPDGVTFRTFAPNAAGIEVLHNNRQIPMHKIVDGNFYEATIPDAKAGDTYEYRIYKQGGCYYTDHCDPYGYGMELRPNHKSIIRDLNTYRFNDADWMKHRSNCTDKPLNIYELHAGSWKKPSGQQEDWYRYDELADLLIPYLKESGYNYIELLPISEHPCDESWGYQNTGFFSPTSRYGTAEDLMRMIDKLHQNQIGVILDFVPVHFAVDSYALAQYDGSALYEYPHNDVGVSEWGSHNFMHSRGEIRCFLQSAADYWLNIYHFDGLRMDAISRIIYWQGDERRGVNGNAVEFLKFMNRGLKGRNPGCLLAAEDSTNFANVTKAPEEGGLGFDYKWDMGWMHDTLDYFQTPPEGRTDKYHQITFSMMYYDNEQYMLPFSHDEVVHGKATILQKMSNDYDVKFPQARVLYMYMMMHPGKKLNFMGNEFGQLREWDEKREQDWMLFQYDKHRAFYRYMCELNHLYLKHPAMSAWDYRKEGFEWIDCHQEIRCVYSFARRSDRELLITVLNLNAWKQDFYSIELPSEEVELLLYSDWRRFDGATADCELPYTISNGRLNCVLSPFSGFIIRCGLPTM